VKYRVLDIITLCMFQLLNFTLFTKWSYCWRVDNHYVVWRGVRLVCSMRLNHFVEWRGVRLVSFVVFYMPFVERGYCEWCSIQVYVVFRSVHHLVDLRMALIWRCCLEYNVHGHMHYFWHRMLIMHYVISMLLIFMLFLLNQTIPVIYFFDLELS